MYQCWFVEGRYVFRMWQKICTVYIYKREVVIQSSADTRPTELLHTQIWHQMDDTLVLTELQLASFRSPCFWWHMLSHSGWITLHRCCRYKELLIIKFRFFSCHLFYVLFLWYVISNHPDGLLEMMGISKWSWTSELYNVRETAKLFRIIRTNCNISHFRIGNNIMFLLPKKGPRISNNTPPSSI